MEERKPINVIEIGPFKVTYCDADEVADLEEDYEILKASFDSTTKMTIYLKDQLEGYKRHYNWCGEKMGELNKQIESLKVCGNCYYSYTTVLEEDECELEKQCSRVYDDRIDDHWKAIK